MEQTQKNTRFGLVMAVYLMGIFMGALDTAIITPARTIIQNNFGVDEKTGIWMITIYTLAYAASIPVLGKLADEFGRKTIYLLSILLFGLGSLFVGLSASFGGFGFLLAARAVQAIGGGGILPIATAEFGTTFPHEKRGMALGMVGGVYGIANIFGASAGSAIIDAFGMDRWPLIFFINLPITVFILAAGLLALPNTRAERNVPIDYAGISILTAMVLSLMYGLRNIDFFDFATTVSSLKVYPFLLAFVVLLPLFIWVEHRAKDPVINLNYFRNPSIVITLVLGMIAGFVIIGMIFVPQFAENALKIKAGSGGYFVLILGLFAGVGAPFSGRLIDRYGVKLVLGFGLIVSILGSLYLIFVAIPHPILPHMIVSLVLMGLGIGFTMGTPLNYMMLENTRSEESNSALATLSLIRSVGTAIAPAILVGFLAHAGMNIQANVLKELPQDIHVPPLPYTQELTDTFSHLKSDPDTAQYFASVEIPDLNAMQTVKIDLSGQSGSSSGTPMPGELVTLLKSSDVTTIVDNAKTVSDRIFSDMSPQMVEKIDSGLSRAETGVGMGITQMNKILGVPMVPDIAKQAIRGVISQLETAKTQLSELKKAVPGAFDQAKADYIGAIEQRRARIEKAFQDTLNVGFKQVYLTVVIASLIGLLLLLLYKNPKKQINA